MTQHYSGGVVLRVVRDDSGKYMIYEVEGIVHRLQRAVICMQPNDYELSLLPSVSSVLLDMQPGSKVELVGQFYCGFHHCQITNMSFVVRKSRAVSGQVGFLPVELPLIGGVNVFRSNINGNILDAGGIAITAKS